MTKTQKYFSIGCLTCDGLQIGHDLGGQEFILIFRSKALAQLALIDAKASPEAFIKHPPLIVTISVSIEPESPPVIAPI